ncbi:MAG: PAS domain S-box protein [Fimbriimonadaceae bacterium]|nr:PAS domain S-box protein [Fimbriimonadaceae bacterium]
MTHGPGANCGTIPEPSDLEWLQNLFGHFDGMLYRCEWRVPWRMQHVAGAVEALTGYPAADFLAGRVNWADFVHPDDLAMVDDVVTQAVAARQAYTVEYRLQLDPRTTRWVAERGRASYAADGQPCWLDGLIVDITAQRKTLAALATSEAHHRAIVECSPDILARFDHEARLLFLSPSAGRYLRLPAERLVGRHLAEVGAPAELVELVQRDVALVYATGRPRESELGLRLADGWHVFDWRAVPEHGPAGDVSAVLAIARDVTTERDLARDYQALFNTMLDGFALHEVICDDHGAVIDYRFLTVNPAFERLTGLTAATVVGRTAREVLPELEPLWLRRYGEVALTGRPARFEQYAASLSKWFEVVAYCPTHRQFACVFQDTTERRSAQLERERIFNLSSELLVTIAPDGRPRQANPAWERLLGWTAAELPEVWTSLIYRDDEHLVTAALRSLGPEREQVNFECRCRDRAGQWHWISWNCTWVAAEGTVIGVGRDITERRQRREEQQRRERETQQAQRLESLGVLAGGIAHDFNNVLAAILGYTELALQRLPAGSEVAADLQQVRQASRRAADLTRQILTFARQADVQTRPLNLSPVVRESLRLLRASLPPSITVLCDIPRDLPAVLADPGQIQQVVMNLATNAAQAMPRGGTLSVTAAAAELAAGQLAPDLGLEPGEYVRLEVSDTGDGIAPDLLPRVFEPFFTTKPLGEGTGLGLSTVHGIVRQHRGAIRLQSVVTVGTLAEVWLPASQAACPPPPAVSDWVQGSGRLLVVDDEPAVARLLERLLTRSGYEVTTVLSAAAALELVLGGQRFDAVVCDFMMPEMDGLELASRLLAAEPGLPLILLTGYAAALSPDEVFATGVHELLAKPIDAAVLSEVVQRAVQHGRG